MCRTWGRIWIRIWIGINRMESRILIRIDINRLPIYNTALNSSPKYLSGWFASKYLQEKGIQRLQITVPDPDPHGFAFVYVSLNADLDPHS
jgi:hypothetical protein